MLPKTPMLGVVCAIFSVVAVTASGAAAGGGVRYRGAVYEHRPHQGMPQSRAEALAIMAQNLGAFAAAAATARREHGAQIVVFPEDGISGILVSTYKFYAEVVPSVERIVADRLVPCRDAAFAASPVLQNLSCTAASLGIAVVANMPDLDPTSGAIYNTDVALDTDGRLLMKYHKQHLFFEAEFTPGEASDREAVFDTSFGVRFAMCTCYDILFPSPCAAAVVAAGATELAFPTAWMNAGPLLYSTGVQQAFAAQLGVNVLAANAHLPKYGFTGSGIYAAGGRPLASYLSDDAGDGRLLVAELVSGGGGAGSLIADDVVKVDRAAAAAVSDDVDAVAAVQKITSPPYKYRLLSAAATSGSACDAGFCCSVEYELDDGAAGAGGERFAIGAYNGLKAGQPVKFWMQACALVKCAGATLASCSDAVPTAGVATEFRRFSVAAAFDASVDRARMYPVVMVTGGRLTDMTSGVAVTRDDDAAGAENRWQMAVSKSLPIAVAGLFAHAATPGR